MRPTVPLLVVVASAAPALAGDISVHDYTAVVTSVAGSPHAGTGIAVGSSFSGSFSYDLALDASAPGVTHNYVVGLFEAATAVLGGTSFSLRDTAFVTPYDPLFQNTGWVFDDNNGSPDVFRLDGRKAIGDLAYGLQLLFLDGSGGAWDDARVPASLDIEDFDDGWNAAANDDLRDVIFRLDRISTRERWRVRANIITLDGVTGNPSPVPLVVPLPPPPPSWASASSAAWA